MEIRTIRTEGLGDSTYVVAHDGLGIVVDPQRDIDRFLPVIEELDIEVRWVMETHLHNDYVSGAPDLARALGSELIIPAGAAPVYRHTPAFHREDLLSGGLTIRPIHTPGHTPEHVSYLILVDGVETAVFSGGSLLVGSAGRSDLLGMDRADTLARLQFRSINRLAALPAETRLYPTHGAGSFCTATVAGNADSTIGVEVRTNPVLTHRDEDAFAAAHLSGLAPFPDYYQHMGPANLQGRPAPDLHAPPTVEAGHLDDIDDVVVVDARSRTEFASGHIPGSIAVELRKDFGVWVGWMIPFNSPLVLVLNQNQDLDEAQRQLARIGFDRVVGVIRDLDEWASRLVGHEVVNTGEAIHMLGEGVQLLDVRAPTDWAFGTVPGSITCYTPDLADSIPETIDQDRPVLIACESGYRATIAASVLEGRGYQPVVLVGAGVPELLTRA
ncbi:MAG TPA: MBL fold metallo-hydrolase [Acidimicrobiia bacterium]